MTHLKRSFLASLALMLCPALSTAQAEDPQGYWAVITKVTDGDTVWAIPRGADEPIKYRLEGFDTPEPTQYKNADCDAEAMLGDIATHIAVALLDEKELWFQTAGKTGGRNRVLARIQLADGQWFGDVMIERGLAVKWAGKMHDWCNKN